MVYKSFYCKSTTTTEFDPCWTTLSLHDALPIEAKLTTLRMLSAAIKQKEVDERVELDDGAVLAIIEKQIKQRNESAIQFEQGGRPESAEVEKAEAAVLASYLPAQLSEEIGRAHV